MEKLFNLKQTRALKTIISVAICFLSVAMYFAFGFFFDVFLEVTPLLLVPFIFIPLFWHYNRFIVLCGPIK